MLRASFLAALHTRPVGIHQGKGQGLILGSKQDNKACPQQLMASETCEGAAYSDDSVTCARALGVG